MARLGVFTLLGFVALGDGLLGCDLSCDKENGAAVPFTGGRVSSDGTSYETNAWNEPYIKFPAGRRLAIAHRLGAEPWDYASYLAFVEYPLAGTRGNTAESAGNMVIAERINAEVVVVHNDTCQDFWLRFTAIVPPGSATGGTGGAPGATGEGGVGGN